MFRIFSPSPAAADSTSLEYFALSNGKHENVGPSIRVLHANSIGALLEGQLAGAAFDHELAAGFFRFDFSRDQMTVDFQFQIARKPAHA